MHINLAAPINSLGYGVVGLNIAAAFEAAGHRAALWPIGNVEAPERHHEALRVMCGRQAAYHSEAPSLRIFHQFDLAQHVGKRLHCALPIFELDRFRPVESHHLCSQDLVFAPSEWAAQVLIDNNIEQERIHYAPFGVDHQVFAPCPGYEHQEPTVFLNVGKWEVRKGHDLLVKAFNAAFGPADNVRLIMHCFNPCFADREQMQRYNGDWVKLYKSSPLGDKIQVLDGRLPNQEAVAQVMHVADCGVFPSRAEGWGLESAEMLAMGKHVILTNYAGHTEYATQDNSLLIEIDELEEAHDGIWFKANASDWQGNAGRWASLGANQFAQLVEHLRDVHKSKQEGSLGVNVAGIESMAHLTWANTVREIVSVLE